MRARGPKFHHFPRPPAITATCRSSRATALRHGLFLLPATSPTLPDEPDSAVWFSADSDVLYLDLDSLGAPWDSPSAVPGIEWRSFFDSSVPVREYADEKYRWIWSCA